MRFPQFVMVLLSATLSGLSVSALPRESFPDRKELVMTTASDVAQATTLILLPQEQEIELALSAGPEHLRLDATVYVFGKNGYKKTHTGTNGFTCMVNRDGNLAVYLLSCHPFRKGTRAPAADDSPLSKRLQSYPTDRIRAARNSLSCLAQLILLLPLNQDSANEHDKQR
jgi:hypothetical protein